MLKLLVWLSPQHKLGEECQDMVIIISYRSNYISSVSFQWSFHCKRDLVLAHLKVNLAGFVANRIFTTHILYSKLFMCLNPVMNRWYNCKSMQFIKCCRRCHNIFKRGGNWRTITITNWNCCKTRSLSRPSRSCSEVSPSSHRGLSSHHHRHPPSNKKGNAAS